MVRKSKKVEEELDRKSDWAIMASLAKNKNLDILNFEDDVRYSQYIPTSLPNIDAVLAEGRGLPRGGMVELFGPESGGKSHFAMKIVASAQQKFPAGPVVYCDLEESITENRAKELGVNLDKERLFIVENDYDGEKLFQFLYKDVIPAFDGRIPLLVIDSIPSINPKEFYEKEEEKRTTLLPAIMSKHMKNMKKTAIKYQVCVIFINQLREKPGMGGPAFIAGYDNTYTPGGRALRHAYDVRMEVRPIGKSSGGPIEKDGKLIGNHSLVKVKKNKIGSPIADDRIPIYFESVSIADRLFWKGREISPKDSSSKKIISVRGDVYSFGEHSIEGEEEFKEAMSKEGWLRDVFNELSAVNSTDSISEDEVSNFLLMQ